MFSFVHCRWLRLGILNVRFAVAFVTGIFDVILRSCLSAPQSKDAVVSSVMTLAISILGSAALSCSF